MFSTLGDRVAGAAVLDLFAGSGALGIEALSRGAARVTFVEHDRQTVRVLRENLAVLGLHATVVAVDATRFVRELDTMRAAGPYDLVFCDPPYRMPSATLVALLLDLAGGSHLARDAMMVVERGRQGEGFVIAEDVLEVTDVRAYGDTVLYYLAVRRVTRDVI